MHHASETKTLQVNGEAHAVAAATLDELIEELGLSDRPVATMRNGDVVCRADRPSCILSEGDRIEIISMVGGG